MLCPKCGYAMDAFETDCPRCAVAPPPMPPKPVAPPPPTEPDRKTRGVGSGIRWVLCVALALIGFAAVFLGKFHIVSSVSGTRPVAKLHFTWAETFVSLDAITGMPFVQARSKWPLAVKALQNEGILETDEEFEARLEAEQAERLEKATREAQAEYDRILRGLR